LSQHDVDGFTPERPGSAGLSSKPSLLGPRNVGTEMLCGGAVLMLISPALG
jgi:hypothetical protein